MINMSHFSFNIYILVTIILLHEKMFQRRINTKNLHDHYKQLNGLTTLLTFSG